ncbi:hypothetical protein [Methanolobus psychrotolerans]|uniref:hypothetical protein n=1 Tax=Methanolobus psychrotolerans TaxID=1874706 RepID=UPI000B91C426|nr:hypothetical protein [Methanolobus psychrotolerans]
MGSETIEKTVIRIEADVKNALSQIDKVKKEIGGVETETNKVSSGTGKSSVLMTAAWAAVAAAVVAATAAVTAFTLSSAKAASEVEQYMVSLGVLYRSEQAAAEQMQWIFEFAKSTPFEVAGLVDATVKLKAFGLEAQDVLEIIGDTAAATSKPIDQVVNAYGRLSVGDTGQAIAMFRDIGVNLKNIEELQFDAQGSLVTPIAEAMPMVKMYLEDQFGGLMIAQSQTAQGIGSNIKDAMYQAQLAFAGFDQETAEFREGSLFSGVKDSLQGVLNVLNMINFDEIGKTVGSYLKTSLNQIEDMKRGLDGVDISGIIGMLKLFGAAWWKVFQLIDEYNIWEYIGKAVKISINAINAYLNFFVNGYVSAMNTLIDVYNTMAPMLEKAGMELESLQRISLDKSLSNLFKDTEDAAGKAKTEIEETTDAVKKLQEQSGSIPGWAGQSDYIRARLTETGGRNISDLLGMAGVSSNIGGNQTVGSLTAVNNQNSLNPTASLVDINRSGFNTLAAKLDSGFAGMINAIGSISSPGSSGFAGTSNNDKVKNNIIGSTLSGKLGVGQVRLRY